MLKEFSDFSVPLFSNSFICLVAFSTRVMPYLSQSYSFGIFQGGYAPAGYPAESRLEYIARSDSAPASSAQKMFSCPGYSSPPLPFRYNVFAHGVQPYTPLSAPVLAASLRYRAENILPYASSAPDTFIQLFSPQPEYHFQPDLFLKPGKEGRFVGKAEEIREDIEKAFELLAGEPFPDDIKLSVLPAEEFRKLAPHPSTVGISFNRRNYGLLSEIFVLNDSLGRVMLTIGHEIGHVLTPPLAEKLNEEAKAYAFSLRWMEIIRKHDIAGLAGALVTETPAENGLHDIAFSFVRGLLKEGKSAGDIHYGLVRGTMATAG